MPEFTEAFIEGRLLLKTIAEDPYLRLPEIKDLWRRRADTFVQSKGFAQIVKVFGEDKVRDALGEKALDGPYDQAAPRFSEPCYHATAP